MNGSSHLDKDADISLMALSLTCKKFKEMQQFHYCLADKIVQNLGSTMSHAVISAMDVQGHKMDRYEDGAEKDRNNAKRLADTVQRGGAVDVGCLGARATKRSCRTSDADLGTTARASSTKEFIIFR